METVSWRSLRSFAAIAVGFLLAGTAAQAQVNSGSNGSDGAFNPTTNTVINMADHPDGIYQYTSVNISNGVTVTFIPNANNTPVAWLIQSNVVINGTVDVSGQDFPYNGPPGLGGPGGYRGGNSQSVASDGQGPGGGPVSSWGGNASYGTIGAWNSPYHQPPRPQYGNIYLLPLLGGSGGGGSTSYAGGGGGGGGAILIAASSAITLNGTIASRGGAGGYGCGGGSGGAVRLVASIISGTGAVTVTGGVPANFGNLPAGTGRVRFDTFGNNFAGSISGAFTYGFQPIIIPIAGQGAQLTVASVGGVPVSASPTGQLSTPDAVLSAQQNNPIPIVVRCSNLPLNTQITISVKPANAPAVSATGFNNTGTLASSTATVSLNMPRGGGIIYATAAIGN